MKSLYILLVSIIFSCVDNSSEAKLNNSILDKVKVKDVSFVIYQSDNYDMVNSISYEIVNKSDSILSRKMFLTGSHNVESGVGDFYSGTCSDIIYLAYPDEYNVLIVFNLRDGKGNDRWKFNSEESFYSYRDSIFEILQSCNTKLKWSHGE